MRFRRDKRRHSRLGDQPRGIKRRVTCSRDSSIVQLAFIELTLRRYESTLRTMIIFLFRETGLRFSCDISLRWVSENRDQRTETPYRNVMYDRAVFMILKNKKKKNRVNTLSRRKTHPRSAHASILHYYIIICPYYIIVFFFKYYYF